MRRSIWLAAALFVAIAATCSLPAQSLLYRSANLGGTWVVDPGVVQFNFVHRFYIVPGPGHVVVNDPTFTLATGIGSKVALGGQFATHSFLIKTGAGSESSSETQVLARWRAWGGPEGSEGLHVSLTPAYNLLAKSADGELGADWTSGPVTLEGAARVAAKPLGQSGARAAFGGGAVVRVNRYVAFSTDVGSFVSPTVRAAWSAALHLLIPGSPHPFSLHLSNAATTTIQGNSIGQSQRLYGFEFTIPLHLKRFAPWFHGSPKPAALGPAAAVAAEVRMAADAFQTPSVTISAGDAGPRANHDAGQQPGPLCGHDHREPRPPPTRTQVHRL